MRVLYLPLPLRGWRGCNVCALHWGYTAEEVWGTDLPLTLLPCALMGTLPLPGRRGALLQPAQSYLMD